MINRVNTSWMHGLRLLFAGGLVFLFLAFQQHKKEDWLHWKSPDQLSAADFKKKHPGRPVKSKWGKRSYRVLEGFIQIGVAFSYSSINGRLKTLEVYSYMVPEDSWLLDQTNLSTLEHEQAHFNIAEIYARVLRKKLRVGMKVDQARRLYQQTLKDMKKRQQSFDQDHTGENGVTEKWKLTIKEELKGLDSWSAKRSLSE